MVSPGTTRSSLEELEPSQEDWPAQIADTIENVVGTIRDKTTGPALTVARAVVYGTFAAIVAIPALILLVICAGRLLDSYLPDAVFGEHHMWVAHLILGLLFSFTGAILWAKRRATPEQTSPD